MVEMVYIPYSPIVDDASDYDG
ncbi:hypothetical protein MCQ_01476, partial [Candidatus Bartonella washoeensis Sb944nv]